MTFRILKTGDGRQRGLISDWTAWLKMADIFHDRYLDRIRYSPFSCHEVSCVGFLASAAAMAGFVPASEYQIEKTDKNDPKKLVNGRADLWFAAGERCYSIEAKTAYWDATPNNLSKMLCKASNDAYCIQEDEYNYAAGCLIAHVDSEERKETYEDFADSSDVDLSFHIGPEGVDGAYLYFSLKD